MVKTIAIIGGSGALGSAFVNLLSAKYPNARVYVFSRQLLEHSNVNVIHHVMDYQDEHAIAQAAVLAAEKYQHLFAANTTFPALVAKYFLPKLNKDGRSVFAALSARVGSISDNRLGGWYAYRASKAALNMIIKNAAIEVSRRNKRSIVVVLHPGTMDSNLSKPFQANVPDDMLFTPDISAEKLWQVLERLGPEHSGNCYAWDGQEIKP